MKKFFPVIICMLISLLGCGNSRITKEIDIIKNSPAFEIESKPVSYGTLINTIFVGKYDWQVNKTENKDADSVVFSGKTKNGYALSIGWGVDRKQGICEIMIWNVNGTSQPLDEYSKIDFQDAMSTLYQRYAVAAKPTKSAVPAVPTQDSNESKPDTTKYEYDAPDVVDH